jgi:hypothetical protein
MSTQRTSRAQGETNGKSRIARWVFPAKTNLHAGARLLFAAVSNVALLIYVLPRKEHLLDIRDYRYVSLDRHWAFLIATIPLVIIVALLPVFRSDRPLHRWIAIGLFCFPFILALVQWVQLLTL